MISIISIIYVLRKYSLCNFLLFFFRRRIFINNSVRTMILRYLYIYIYMRACVCVFTPFSLWFRNGAQSKRVSIRFLLKRFSGGAYRYRWIGSIVNHATRCTFFFIRRIRKRYLVQGVFIVLPCCFCLLFASVLFEHYGYISVLAVLRQTYAQYADNTKYIAERYTVHVAGITRDEFYPTTFQMEICYSLLLSINNCQRVKQPVQINHFTSKK